MATEEIRIYGIFHPSKVLLEDIQFKEFENLVKNHLEFQPIFEVVKQIMEENFQINTQDRVQLSDIFNALNHVEFYKRIPAFLNGRRTQQNIKIVTAALIVYKKKMTMEDIKKAVLVFQLKEREHLKEGVPCDPQILNNMLRRINKAIYYKILQIWIEKSRQFFEIKDVIQTHEFLYLCCNALDRLAFWKNIPKIEMEAKMDKKTKIFKFDNQKYKHLRNPDDRIQAQMQYHYLMDENNKHIFEGMDVKNEDDMNIVKKKNKIENILKNEDNADFNEFRKLLYDRGLFQQIKNKLKSFHQILNHSKLSGKSLRYKILDELKSKRAVFITDNQQEQPEKMQDNFFNNLYNEDDHKDSFQITQIRNHPKYILRQKQSQKPIDSEVVGEMMNEIQQHREHFREQVQQEYRDRIEKRNEQQNRIDQSYNILQGNVQVSQYQKRPVTASTKAVSLLDQVIEEDCRKDFEKDRSNSKGQMAFYGTSRLSSNRNFTIQEVKQILRK